MKNFKYTGFYGNTENDMNEFHYNVELTAEEKIQFVCGVVNMMIGDHYNYIVRDMLFDYSIISVFTDYDLTSIVKSEHAVMDIENLLATTNIVDQVKMAMDESLINELNFAIDRDIEYKTGIRMNSVENSIAKFIDTLTQKMKQSDLQNIMKDIFKNMNAENVVNAYMKSDIFKQRNTEIVNAKKQQNKSDKAKVEVIQ